MAAGNLAEIDAHEQPSDEMRAEWKGYMRQDHKSLLNDPRIDDPRAPLEESGFRQISSVSKEQVAKSFARLDPNLASQAENDIPIIHHPLLPDTPASFLPKDPSVHKPLSIKQVMQRKLHWVTLGGQYDWTNRAYPEELPPMFPDDISRLLEDIFPETVAQAAILNFYTPGDTMMMHRDVSEETDKGLISLSFGCDGLFMIAPNDLKPGLDGEISGEKQYLLLRLRSGDAIYMTQESRYAWHGVPKVLKDTCPSYLEDWPARDDGRFEEWQGWMKNKRINLNVRQMRD
ncbi:Alkylated dna repair protein [Fusarium acuminatum]|uniref:Alkylated dna repair protein n=1 Tax=Fusarium acuminatum TaxID=5515 RepID=A0ABZ2WM05_9HYPO